ncbi:MAG: hypothetical protein U0P46_08645 [Holophagaceae bacterium]
MKQIRWNFNVIPIIFIVLLELIICSSSIGCGSKNTNNSDNIDKIRNSDNNKIISEVDKQKVLSEHKRRVDVIFNKIFIERHELEPISQINQSDLEESINEVNNKIEKNGRPSWVFDSWEIISRLNPRGGWYSTLYSDYYSNNNKIMTIENEIKNQKKEYTVASKFYLKRQFSENEWELVIAEKNFLGNAVFRGSQNDVRRLRLEQRIVSGIILKNLGKEPFKYDRFNAYGPTGSSTEYFYVYELGDYDFEYNKNILKSLKIENNKKQKELKDAELSIRNAYKNYCNNYK